LAGGAEDDEVIEFSEAQKAFILKHGAGGAPVADLSIDVGGP